MESQAPGKWGNTRVPHAGWTCSYIQDAGEDWETCEMCEAAEIRYVHIMEHPKHETLRCGCVCAGRMEQDVAGAVEREKRFRNRAVRQRNWLLRKWRISAKGNHYLNTDGFNIVVFFNRGSELWASSITDRRTGKAYYSKRPYETPTAARLGAFDGLMFLLGRQK